VLNHTITALRKIESSRPKLKNKLADLKDLRSLYAKCIYLSVEERESRGLDPSKLLATIRLKEKMLLQLSDMHVSSSTFDWKMVQNQLGDNQAAIQVLHAPADDRIKAISTYEAIIIRKDLKQPIIARIGEDDLMDTKFYVAFMKAIGYKIQEGKSYERYWKPFDEHLDGVERVFFCGEGIYHKLSVGALFDGSAKRYLGDRLDIVNVSSLTQSSFKDSYASKKGDVVFFGNPEFYDGAVREGETYTIDHHVTRSKVKIREEWGDLPGAEEEVIEINELCKANGYNSTFHLGVSASEEKVKALNNPNILHLATHGFYEYNQDTVSSMNSVHSFIHPMLNSALLLSGGGVSYGLRKKHSLSIGEDGVLSAFETQNLILNKTNLVVLSACESGLGSVRDAEGVFGLQRGFLLAGADHIMMSLWKVNDLATKDFMIAFYSAYLTGAEIHDACRKARIKTRLKYPEPAYWAAFVLLSN
jgi:CHAT domain-containing protein